MFGFRNPGNMRIPVEMAVRGGESDGRNRTLQQMFLLIGAGERAGSGVSKIHKGWREQHWRPPSLYDRAEPSEQTLLELHMEDLLPVNVVEALRSRFGEKFEVLSSEQRVILATAMLETTVSHARAMAVCDLHPADLTRYLQAMVQDELLVKVGAGRGSRYHLPGLNLLDPDEVFAAPMPSAVQPSLKQPSELVGQSSDPWAQPSDLIREPSDLRSPARTGRVIQGLDLPLIDDLERISPELRSQLRAIAERVGPGRVKTALMDDALIDLCKDHFLTLKVIARLVGREENYMRQNYLNRLAVTGYLRRAFPSKPNDPRQAYSSQIRGAAND